MQRVWLAYQAHFADGINPPNLPATPTRKFVSRIAARGCVGCMLLDHLKAVRKDATGLDIILEEQVEHPGQSLQHG